MNTFRTCRLQELGAWGHERGVDMFTISVLGSC